MRPSLLVLLIALPSSTAGLSACAGDAGPDGSDAPFAVEVVSFDPGPGAGFGADAMPGVVLGPPQGGFTSQGSTDVVSLGQGGSIVLRLGQPLTDGEGADLLVFENPFEVPGGAVFGEPGEVGVSDDGETFIAFPCAPSDPAPNGCAGFGLVIAGEGNDLDPTDPAAAGGDAFDLDEVGVHRAQFVKITDRGTAAVAPTAGFDLDALAVVGAVP